MVDRTVNDLLLRLDQVLAEVVQLRGELAAYLTSAPAADGVQVRLDAADDLLPEHLIEISTAVERFNRPVDTIRFWCRQDGGVKRGGRWLVSVPRIVRYLNGGG
jgi:hypothetical protein